MCEREKGGVRDFVFYSARAQGVVDAIPLLSWIFIFYLSAGTRTKRVLVKTM